MYTKAMHLKGMVPSYLSNFTGGNNMKVKGDLLGM
jgi:hypothetical protein